MRVCQKIKNGSGSCHATVTITLTRVYAAHRFFGALFSATDGLVSIPMLLACESLLDRGSPILTERGRPWNGHVEAPFLPTRRDAVGHAGVSSTVANSHPRHARRSTNAHISCHPSRATYYSTWYACMPSLENRGRIDSCPRDRVRAPRAGHAPGAPIDGADARRGAGRRRGRPCGVVVDPGGFRTQDEWRSAA